MNKFLLHRAIPHFSAKHAVSERVKEFCLELTEYARVKNFTKFQDTTVLDSGRVKETTDDEKSAFLSAQIQFPDEVVVHRRMVHKGLVYTSKAYSLSKRRRECYVKLNDGSHGEIQNIISLTSEGNTEIALFLKTLHRQASFPLTQGNGFVPHIRVVSGSHLSPVCLISVDRLDQKCMILKTGDQTYICTFPNVHERD